MSSVYVLEPPTKGKVVLKTTCGPLDIELWPKEAPKACRNFVQLCMEGYYNHTIFHRVIKEFLVQGGDHTGTGEGGESIYEEPFADEIHTRLKFRHRGLVACAGSQDKKNSNNSQFFITLTRCDWINGQHTIFGKVTGDTIYNLLKLAECETGKDDRPLEPHSITSTEVLWNPFDDIVPRNRIKPVETPAAPPPQEKPKQKKRLNLLSFGDEAEEEVPVTNAKITSSHDVLDDPRLLKPVQEEVVDDNERRKKELSAVKQALAGKSAKEPTEDPLSDREDEQSFDARMRQQLMEKKRKWDEQKAKPSPSIEKRPKRDEPDEKEESEEDEEDENVVRKDKLVIKKKGIGSEAKAEMALKKDVEMQLLTPQEQQRQKVKQQKRNLRGREESTMALLERFQQKLKASKTSDPVKSTEDEAGQGDPDKEEVDTAGLFNHKLKFQVDKKDKMARNDDVDQYVVVDPLLEKGKEQFNKQQAMLKRRNRAWAGKSYT